MLGTTNYVVSDIKKNAFPSFFAVAYVVGIHWDCQQHILCFNE